MNILPLLYARLTDSMLPVNSISMGDLDNKATWTVNFKSEATKEQRLQAQAIVDAFNPVKEETQQHAIVRVQAFMDAKAQEFGYDHILSASSYVTSTLPKFQTEGIAFAKWRDDVWLHCYSVLAEWEAGTSKITTEDELIASLPVFKVEY